MATARRLGVYLRFSCASLDYSDVQGYVMAGPEALSIIALNSFLYRTGDHHT
jgi:hypothetical protein